MPPLSAARFSMQSIAFATVAEGAATRQLGERVTCCGLEPLVLAGRARWERLLQARMALAAAAQVRVRGPHHVPQRVRFVRRDHLDAVGIRPLAHELLEGSVERIRGEPL